MPNPRLPKDPRDQTGMGKVRAGANRKLKAALNRVAAKIYRYTLQIEPLSSATNSATNASVYSYDMDPYRLATFSNWIQSVLYLELLGSESGMWTQDWFLNGYLGDAYESGTDTQLDAAQRLADPKVIGTELSSTMRALQIATIVADPGFQQRLRNVYGRVFNGMTGISDTIKAILAGDLAQGMAKRKSPRWIARQLRDKTNQQYWRLLRISRTEINRAYTDASLDEQQELNRSVYGRSKYEMRTMHLSALAENTRSWHAFRHGWVGTATEQQEWWNKDGNRINCQCGTTDVLVNKKTGAIVNADFVDEVRAQRSIYFGR